MTHSEHRTSVPPFPPVLPRRGRRLRRTMRDRRAFGLALALTAALLAAFTFDGADTTTGTDPARTEQAARAAPTEPAPHAGAFLPPPAVAPPAPALSADGPTSAGASRPPAPLVSAPVRISDPATVRLLSPGDRVDILATPVLPPHADTSEAARRPARRVAHRARVAQIPATSRGGQTGSAEGALIVLAVSPATAAALAGAAADSRLAVTKW